MFQTVWISLPAVWQASWQAACLAAIVGFVLWILKKQLAPRWRFAVWSLVFVRLALPVTPASPMSVFGIWSEVRRTAALTEKPTSPAELPAIVSSLPIAEESAAPAGKVDSRLIPFSPHPTIPMADAGVSAANADIDAKVARAARWSWMKMASAVWLSGVVILLLRRGLQQWRLSRQVRLWSPVEEPSLVALLSECCRRAGLRGPVTLLATDERTGPAIAGIFSPRLLIPASMLREFSAERLEMIFLHELAHLRRRDLLVQEILLALRAVHWFNPVSWWTLHRLQLEREMACDEFVLSVLGTESRQAYGRTLLDVLERGFGRSLIPGLLGTVDRLQQRIQTIRDFQPRSRATSCLAVGLLLLIGAIGLTSPVAPRAAEPIPSVAITAPAPPQAIALASNTFVVQGKCVADDGRSLPAVKLVLLLREAHSTRILQKWEQLSGSAGEFRFEKLPTLKETEPRQRSYVLAASKSKWTSTYREFGVHRPSPPEGYQLKLSTKVGVLSGRVLDEHGWPLAGASVYTGCSDGPLPGFLQSTTDAQGRYAIDGMNLWKAGTATFDPVTGNGAVCTGCSFRVKHPKYPLMMAMHSGIPEVVDVQLSPGMVIEGKVVDTLTGKPAADATVIVQGINRESFDRTLTDAQGNYKFLMTEDDYKILVKATDRVALPIGLVSGAVGKTTQAPDIKLVAGGRILGRLLDKATGKPFPRPAKGEPARILCYEPSPTKNKLNTTFATVAEDGTFQLRTAPGINALDVSLPYDLANPRHYYHSARSTKSIEITVHDGESVAVALSASVDPTPDSRGLTHAMHLSAKTISSRGSSTELTLTSHPRERRTRDDNGKLLVDRPQTPAGKLLDRLEDEQSPGHHGDTWGEIVRDLIGLGPSAVPELITELDEAQKPYMISSLAFVLRGIGDRRAVPALIRALPRTCLTGEFNDMGYTIKDAKLAAFLRKIDFSAPVDPKSQDFTFGRPINEVRVALQKLTGTTQGEDELAGITALDAGSMRQQYLRGALFERCAERWAAWWQQNHKKSGVPVQYAAVNLPKTTTVAAVALPDQFPHGAGFQIRSQASNLILQSVRNPQAQYVFFDFDTGRNGVLPAHLKAAATDSERLDDILAWAAREGFDLMGTEYTLPREKKSHYVLRALGMTTWEIDVKRWPKLPLEIAAEKPLDMGTRTNGLLAHFDAARGQYLPDQTAAFLFQTRDGTHGAMFVGVEVHDDNWKPSPEGQEEELNPTGYVKGRRYTFYLIHEVGPKGPQRAVPHR